MSLSESYIKGKALGEASTNRFTGVSDMIKAITAKVQKQKDDIIKNRQTDEATRGDLAKTLLSKGYSGDWNALLKSGDMSSFKKGSGQSILNIPEGMKIKSATMDSSGETSYSFEPLGGATKTLPIPAIDKISKNEDAYYSLSSSANQLIANKDKYAQFLGPGKDILRTPFRSYVNKDLQDFLGWKANVQDAFQQYRVAVTGAQASDKEILLLAKNRPTENDTYEVFLTKTKNVKEIGRQIITRYINNLKRAGYNTEGYEATLQNLENSMNNATIGNGGENLLNSQGRTRISVIAPDGTEGTISINSLQEALASGYRRK